MSDKPLPCPLCGSDDILLKHTTLRPRMDGIAPAIVSVTLTHSCKRGPGIVGARIEVRGRDQESAVAAWNLRI